jgi:hypothetical protein
MYQVVFSQAALADLIEAQGWYESRDPGHAGTGVTGWIYVKC